MKIKDKVKNIKIDDIVCFYIILCPILDIMSFLFRNSFNTKISPTTIIRPIIPTLLIIYLFIKKDKNYKIKLILLGCIYLLYAAIHIYLFSKIKTQMSFGTETHELQYVINYTFNILNLIIFITIFRNKDTEKLKKSVLISTGIYITSIYISIITHTSSYTYIEGMGYKGWFESGNSISAILLLSLFIYLPYIKDKKMQKIAIPIVILVGMFLCLLIGTRAGLAGFIIVVMLYLILETLFNVKKEGNINKKFLIIGVVAIVIMLIIVICVGSTTIQRRKHLREIESDIIDNSNNENSHITGSILEIKERIEKNEDCNDMSEEQKQSILDLYNIANKLKIKNYDQRNQQLIYNLALVKNQKSILLILFGNGYVANYRELVLEMELASMLINFGLIGFMLYIFPFIYILFKSLYYIIKFRKEIEVEYVFLWFGDAMAFALSLLSGYTFFSLSTATIIIVINTLLYVKTYKLDWEKK